MWNIRRQVLLQVLCLVIVFLVGCESLEEKGQHRLDMARSAQGDIVVGVSWPISAHPHHMFIEGIQLAVDEINRDKLLGRNLSVIIRDDKSQVERGLKIARQFANNPEMIAVIGHFDAELAVRAAVTYEFSNLLYIANAVQHNSITRHKFKHLIRTCINNENLGTIIAAKTKEMGFKKPVVISEQTKYGRDLAHNYIAALDKIQLQVVQDFPISTKQTDFRDILFSMGGLDYDFVFFAGRNPEAAYFLQDLRLDGSEATFLGAFLEDPDFFKIAGDAAEGAIYLDYYHPSMTSPENKNFVTAFHSRYGKEPDTWAASAFDAVMLLAHSIEKSKTTNPKIVARNIHFTKNWKGVIRDYSFLPNGDVSDVEIFFKVVHSGHGEHLAIIEN